MSETRSFRFTAEALLPAPETRWRRFWRRLLRRPAPTVAPEGTRSLLIESVEGGQIVRRYFPAVRIDNDPA